MKRIPKQEYTAEFKEQAVKRADEVDSIGRVAEGLGLVVILFLYVEFIRDRWKAIFQGKLRPCQSASDVSYSELAYLVVPEIFISAVICAFHAAKSHSFRTPRLSFKRSPGRLAAKAGQNRRGIVPFARHKKIALRKGTPFLAIMRSSHLML